MCGRLRLFVAFDQVVRDVAGVEPHHEGVKHIRIRVLELKAGIAISLVWG